MNENWLPASVISLRGYTPKKFAADLVSGITVGLVALPLAMAFAISSGVPPQSGIYCAIVTGFIISALGGSRLQIGGPTGAFVVVVAGIVNRFGVSGLLICTMMAGVMVTLLGLTGMGSAVKFIPRSVVVGFTNGIAALIASTQIKDFCGLRIDKVPSEFLPKMAALAKHASSLHMPTLFLAFCSLISIVLIMRHAKRIPGYLVALFGGTLICWALKLPVETIGSRFGGIPSGLPRFNVPEMHLDAFEPLLLPAVTIAMLGAIESLMSATVADRMSGDKHNPNVELLAQGIANIVSPLFGGLPATGAIARTATNIRSGAQTSASGIIHALTLFAVVVFAAPLASYIPLAVLSAILLVVAYNMGEWGEIPEILKLATADKVVWAVTFGLTVLADLTVAVMVGMILAALLYIRKVTVTTNVAEITEDDIEASKVHIVHDKEIPSYISLYRILGPFLFGATDKLELISDRIDSLEEIVLIRIRYMTAIDGSGIQALEELAERINASGRCAIFCGAREQPARLMESSDFAEKVGAANVCDSFQEALDRAREVYEKRHQSEQS